MTTLELNPIADLIDPETRKLLKKMRKDLEKKTVKKEKGRQNAVAQKTSKEKMVGLTCS